MKAAAPRTGTKTKRSAKKPEAGRLMLYWLSEAAIQLREGSGASVEEVASLAGVSARIIDRFEDGENWPRQLDAILAGYAEVAGLEDALGPWDRALDLWHEHGGMPLISRREEAARARGQKAQEHFLEQFQRQAARTQRQGSGARARKSTASRKPKAAG